MPPTELNILEYETKLGFRTCTDHGWVPGLPRCDAPMLLVIYGEDGENLAILLSGIDAIKEPFANRRFSKQFVITMISVRDKADNLLDRVGASLWPGKGCRTPEYIDPAFCWDFSIGEHEKRIKSLFNALVLAKAFRCCENQSGRKHENLQQQPHSTENGSGDTSEYKPDPQGLMQGEGKTPACGGTKRRPYMTKRRREELRANQKLRDMETGPSISVAVKQSPIFGKDGSRQTDDIHYRPVKRRREIELSDQRTPSETSSLLVRALECLQRQGFEFQTSHNGHDSYQEDSQSTTRGSTTNVHTPHGIATLTTITPLALSAPLQCKLNQPSTRQPSVMKSTVNLSDPVSAPDTMKNKGDLPSSGQSEKARSHEVRQLTNDVSHPAKDPLDTFLRNTEVRLCFGKVDHILMDLEGCNTMTDLCAKIQLYLKEEIGNEQIRFINVVKEDDKQFCYKGMDIKQWKLLPGPIRDRTYDGFLWILPRDKNRSFKMFVHI